MTSVVQGSCFLPEIIINYAGLVDKYCVEGVLTRFNGVSYYVKLDNYAIILWCVSHPCTCTSSGQSMEEQPKRPVGRPRKAPKKAPPAFHRAKSLATSAEELVRFEVVVYRHQMDKVESIATRDKVSRQEVVRRALDSLEP